MFLVYGTLSACYFRIRNRGLLLYCNWAPACGSRLFLAERCPQMRLSSVFMPDCVPGAARGLVNTSCLGHRGHATMRMDAIVLLATGLLEKCAKCCSSCRGGRSEEIRVLRSHPDRR